MAFGTVKCLSSVLYFASQQLRHSFNPSSELGICLGRFYYILQRQPCRRVRVSNGVASCLSGPRSRQLLGFRLHVNKTQQAANATPAAMLWSPFWSSILRFGNTTNVALWTPGWSLSTPHSIGLIHDECLPVAGRILPYLSDLAQRNGRYNPCIRWKTVHAAIATVVEAT